MGLNILRSRCSCKPKRSSWRDNWEPRNTAAATNNPDPDNFEILKFERVGQFTIMLVYYPDCTNFEGKKILVYKTLALGEPLRAHMLDPHFCDSLDHPSPIARFVPTDEGWHFAIHFCKSASA